MLVQALTTYAETYLQDQMQDKAFEEKPVAYALYIDQNGSFLEIRELTREKVEGEKGKPRPLVFSIPKSPVPRNAGFYPLLACDAVPYILGPFPGKWTKDDEQAKHEGQHSSFVLLINRVAEECAISEVTACTRFYCREEEVGKAREAMAAINAKPTGNLAIGVVDRGPGSLQSPRLLIEVPEVKQWWRRHYKSAFQQRVEKGGEGVCLVDGEAGPIAPTNDKIKGASSLGGQASGVSLMSFDKAAFRSYGWEQNANSPVCPEHAAAYVLALNDLMRPGAHRHGLSSDRVVRTRFDAGSAAFLFWTRTPSDDDVARLFQEAQPEDVERLLASPFTGAQYDVKANEFYLLVVSGNGGRLLVRYWFHDKLEQVRENLRNWFRDLHVASVFIQDASVKAPALWQLLKLLQTPGMKNDSPLNTERALFMVRRALHGLPLPRSVLVSALNRLRALQGTDRLNATRIGLIRMCVNDLETVEKKGIPIMPEELDESIEHPAYVCGRLLAAYEALQYRAQGEVNVNVTDRYFSLASTRPQLAFPKLDTLSKAHLKKLRRENASAGYFLEKRIRDLIANLGEAFPAALNIEDQGRFVIGYHHQKAHDARKMAEAKARKNDNVPEEESLAH